LGLDEQLVIVEMRLNICEHGPR